MNRRLLAWLVLVAGVSLSIWGKQHYESAAAAQSPTEHTAITEQGEQAGIIGGILTFAGLILLFTSSARHRDASRDQDER